MTTETLQGKPATQATIDYLTRLAAERDLDLNLLPNWPNLTQAAASWAIDVAKRHAVVTRPAAATPGYYRRGDEVYEVVANKSGTGTYAKILVVDGGRGRWEYAPGVGRTLAVLEPLTVEEAGRIGRRFGVCMICGRTLTNPESIEAGIGPICAGRL